MLLDEVIQSFVHSRQLGLRETGAKGVCRPRTLENYRYHLEMFVKFMQETRGKATWESIKKVDVLAFVAAYQSRTDWTESTKLGLFRVVRMLFRFISKDEECREEKLTDWSNCLPAIKKNPSRTFIPSVKDIRTMQKSFNANTLYGLRNYVVFSLVMGTGLRIGEICFLKLEHLQLDTGYIYVPQEGKTGSRLVPIEDKVVSLLKAWLRRREKITGIYTVPWLFVSRGLRQCNRHTFEIAFTKIQGSKDKGQRITPHTLRHAFGTYYLNNGGDMERLRLTLGHTTYDTTKLYLHLAKVGNEKGKEELERVSPLRMLSEKS